LKAFVSVQPDFRDDNREDLVQDERGDVDRPLSVCDCYLFTPMNYAVAKQLNGPDLIPQLLDVASALEGAKVDAGELVEDSKQDVTKLIVALLGNELRDQCSERLVVNHSVKNRLEQ